MLRGAIVGVILTVSIACKSPTEAPPSGPLVPMREGNQWVYEVQPRLPSTSADTVVTAITSRLELFIAGGVREIFAQHTYHKQTGPSADDVRWFYGNEPEGYFFYGGATPRDTFLLRTPAVLWGPTGAEWLTARVVYTAHDSTFRVMAPIERRIHATSAPCQTPLGGRRCLDVRFYLPPLEDDVAFGDWHQLLIAPGIGMVRHDIYGDSSYTERKALARLIGMALRSARGLTGR